MGYIYKVTNLINQKVYIGKTEHIDPLDRWKEHLSDKNKECCQKRPFYRALNKYGVENFYFEVIDSTNDSDLLCVLEQYYIKEYNSYIHFENSNGYNCTLGGDGRATISLDEKKVIDHYYSNMSIEETSKFFQCDHKIIKKILVNNGVQTLSLREYIRKNFIEIYGGLVQMNNDCTEIIKIFECPMDVYVEHPDYKEKGLSNSYRTHHKTHRYKNCIWYRLNELPEEYKPLLNDYYENIIDNDNQELEDLIFD